MNISKEVIGQLSGAIVALSAVPYLIRAWQKKITPNITSWLLWSAIGIMMFLSFKDSGAKDNLWPVLSAMINPILITIVAFIKKGEKTSFKKIEIVSIVMCVISLALWYALKDDAQLAQFAVYFAILADICAAVPTIAFIREEPQNERPFSWFLFSFGYGLSMFAITDHTFVNYTLPIWMVVGCGYIVVKLVSYRLREKIPLRDWI